MNKERTMLWFQDRDDRINALNDDFFGLSTLLNRLLNERDDGKRLNFLTCIFTQIKHTCSIQYFLKMKHIIMAVI